MSEVVDGFQSGNIEWFLTLFVIPFVLVGLGLLGFAIYSFLGIFNPRPRLMLQKRQLSLGDSCVVRWEFKGRAGRIAELVLTLEGLEEARYQRGTSTYTDTETFHKDVFARETFRANIERGSAEFLLPAQSMHSFSGGNNKIVWKLKMKGDIPNWPDVSEDFTIAVQPQKAN